MPFPIIPLAIAAVQGISSIIAANKQRKANQKLQESQMAASQAATDRMNAYNTPKAQMARFQDAGLNPNLIYGQGSAGNQSSPSQVPEIRPTDYQAVPNFLQQISPQVNQAMLTQSQLQANDARTAQTYAQTEVSRLQAELIKANPLLDDEGFKATIEGLKSAASLKALQVKSSDIALKVQDATQGMQAEKVFREVQLLEQKFNLGTADSAIKAQVLKSKEFQNAILEVQKNFMTDGDITPQHILQFVQMLILKLF